MNSLSECEPVSGTPTASELYNFAHFRDVTGGVFMEPYAVQFNSDVCDVNDAIDACKLSAASVCSAAFNVTNPNSRDLPRTTTFLYLSLVLTFSVLSVALSIMLPTGSGIFGFRDNMIGKGVNARMRAKLDAIVQKMMAKEDATFLLVMQKSTLRFFDEDRENAFSKHHSRHGLRRLRFLFVLLLFLLSFAGTLFSSGNSDYFLRGCLAIPLVICLFMTTDFIYESHPESCLILFVLVLIQTLGGGLWVVYIDFVYGIEVGAIPLTAFVVILNQVIMMQGFIFLIKSFVVIIFTSMYIVLVIKGINKHCYISAEQHSYPIISVFLSLEQYQGSCELGEQGGNNFWCILTTIVTAAFTIYATYSTEKIDRLSFFAKYEVTTQEMETNNRLSKMENALKAKELNHDQLQLVMEMMRDGAGSPGEVPTHTQQQRRFSAVGKKSQQQRRGSIDRRGSMSNRQRRGSISSANAIQQLQIKHENIELVENNIGRGAYGDVHKAKYNGIYVAIKTITAIDRERLIDFRNEILIMNQLRHPNIIMLIGAVWSKEMVGIVLEFADNGSLSDVLKKKKVVEKWSWDHPKLTIANDVAQGMRYVHNTAYYDEFSGKQKDHLFHRDLKTGNVLMTKTWGAKVADFGSTKIADDASGEQTMTMAGTPIYMAPEIVRGEKYDKSCDIYGFGVVLYALSVEKGNVHDGFLSAAEKVQKISTTTGTNMALMNLVAESGIRPDLSQIDIVSSLRVLISRCWSDRPKARPEFSEIVDSLATVAEEIGEENANKMSTRENLRKQEEKEEEFKLEISKSKISRARSSVREFAAPVVLMRASEFCKFKSLLSYETVRDKKSNALVTLDTMEKAETFLKGNYTIFFSHQWLSYSKPDPSNAQLGVMIEATHQLVAETKVKLESTFVWCDYFSIAQESREIQRLAILSLPAVASSLHAFVMVTPASTHQDTLEDCTFASYAERGWCRAELLSHVARRGTKRVFIAGGAGSGLVALDDIRGNENGEDSDNIIDDAKELSVQGKDILVKMCSVFRGNFSCCRMNHKGFQGQCDREKLLEPMLGLYCEIYKRRLTPLVAPIYKVIEPIKETIFPAEIEIAFEKGNSDRRTLFGDMVKIAEAEVDFENMIFGAQAEDGGAVELESADDIAVEDKDLSSVMVHRQDLNFDLGDDGKKLEKFKTATSGLFSLCLYRGHAVMVDALDLSLATDEEEEQDLMSDFKRECLLMKELRHENILMLVGALWSSDLTCLILEFVQGGNMNEFLQLAPKENLQWSKSKLKIAKGVVRGMTYLHGCVFYDSALDSYTEGIIHRCLTPENVLVGSDEDEDGRMTVKIFNFSQSRMIANDQTMTVVGGEFYTAPEVYRGDRYDAKCDVFSFATLMVHLAIAGSASQNDVEDLLRNAIFVNSPGRTGKKSRGGGNRAKMTRMLMKGQIKPELDEFNAPDCPGVIMDLVGRCYAFDPEKRPSFPEIHELLRGEQIEKELIMMGLSGEDEDKLKELKMELARGSELREQELQSMRMKSQKRLRDRMEALKEKKKGG